MSQKIITFCFLSLFCLIGTYTIAQNIQVETKVKNEILQNPLKFGLSVEDASQIVMVTSYTDQKRGISYCYALQTYDDIPIYNALTSFYVGKNGQVGAVKSNFINTHSFQIKGNRASAMSVEDAVKNAAVACGVVNPQPQLLESRGDKLVLAGGNISEEKIEPHYTWYVEQGNLVLGYEMQIKIIGEMDHYKIVVNSQDGRIMNKLNYKLSCKFDGPNQFANHTHDQECRERHLHHRRRLILHRPAALQRAVRWPAVLRDQERPDHPHAGRRGLPDPHTGVLERLHRRGRRE